MHPFSLIFAALILLLAVYSLFWQIPKEWKRKTVTWWLLKKAAKNNILVVLGSILIAISWSFEKISFVQYESDLKELEHQLNEYRFLTTEFRSWLQTNELRRWSMQKPGLDSPTIRSIAWSMLGSSLHSLIEATEASLNLAVDTTSDFYQKTRSSIPEWKKKLLYYQKQRDTVQLNNMLTEISPIFSESQYYQNEAITKFSVIRGNHVLVNYFYLIVIIVGSILITTNGAFRIADRLRNEKPKKAFGS